MSDLKALRHHTFVLAWIAEFQKDPWHAKYSDCQNCGFPHSEVLLCHGAPFGSLYIGGQHYSVDISNVEFMVSFREKPHLGFHWRDDIYFQRQDDGSVQIMSFWQYNNCPQERRWTIPSTEWASIVSSVSASGEIAESYQQVLDFHGKAGESSI